MANVRTLRLPLMTIRRCLTIVVVIGLVIMGMQQSRRSPMARSSKDLRAKAAWDRIEALGGVSQMLLTHKDDVADHELFRKKFDCKRLMHADDGAARLGVEQVIRGEEPVQLDDELLDAAAGYALALALLAWPRCWPPATSSPTSAPCSPASPSACSASRNRSRRPSSCRPWSSRRSPSSPCSPGPVMPS